MTLCCRLPLPQLLIYQGTPLLSMWDNQGYLALWVVQRLALLLLQCAAAHSTAMSFKDTEETRLSPSAVRLMHSIRHM